MFNITDIEIEDAAFGRVQASTDKVFLGINLSQLVAPSTSSTIVVYSNGVPTPGSLAGTANEVSVSQSGTTLTAAFDAGFFLKSYNTASAIRGRIGAPAAASIAGATIPLAKITGGGADGSITVSAEGVVTAYVAPT